MSIDLLLKPSCGGCGSTTDLYESNSKHMTLCFTCVKTMAENKAKCFDCGATVTRLIREYSVRASTGNGKNYFIGRFVSGLPDFSKKKSAENKWCLQKDGLQSRQVTDADEDDEDEDNEEGGGLSKYGKELKKLLGRTSDLNESDDEDDDDEDDDVRVVSSF